MITTIQLRILKALKNADMNSSELLHKFGKSVAVHLKTLTSEGYVEQLGDVYSMTQKGSAAAPKRLLDTPPVATPAYEVKKAERISINAKIHVDALSKYIPPAAVKVAENERVIVKNTVNKITNTSEPRALQILRVIEANPGCGHSEIEYATGIEGAHGYIKSQILAGRVIVGGTARKRTYQLAEGLTADSIYNGGSRIRTKSEPATQATPATPGLHVDDVAVPEFLKKPAVEASGDFKLIRLDETALVKDLALPVLESKLVADKRLKTEIKTLSVSIKPERKFKIAYTNDKTLMLFGLDYQPIELSKDETEELVDFCAQMDLTFNVGVA